MNSRSFWRESSVRRWRVFPAPQGCCASPRLSPGRGWPVKRITVLTRGGDAPGMNSVIRAIVRAGADRGLEVYGVRHGFNGLIIGDMRRLGPRDVSGSMQLARLLWPDHQRGVGLLAGGPRQP